MRIAMVCPYSWDVPGGAQQHVRDLSRALASRGCSVSVIAPGRVSDAEDDFVVLAGRAWPVHYNGSVARVQPGLVAARRVRSWLRSGDFDVVHVHEPVAPSLSLLATAMTDRPVVATFHAASERSRALSAFRPALAPVLRKVRVAIAVSGSAAASMANAIGPQSALRPLRRPVLSPNGINVSSYRPAPAEAGPEPQHVLGFLGRTGDPRKGLPVLVEAFNRIAERRADVALLVVGPADEHLVRRLVDPRFAGRVEITGVLAEPDKVRALHRMTLLCAPNLGGESFGMVLAEGLAAGVPVLASDIDPFRELLDGGSSGVLFEAGNWRRLADEADALLDDPSRRRELSQRGRDTVARYDWAVLVPQVLAAYGQAIRADCGLTRRWAPASCSPGTPP